MENNVEKVIGIVEHMTDEDRKIFLRRIIQHVAGMSESDQMDLIRSWLGAMEDERRMDVAMMISGHIGKILYPWDRIDRWMESRFTRDMSITPKRAAYEARHYFRAKRQIGPILIRMAQRIKNRVAKRHGRSGL